jgi:DNA-binding MarR family transcriptional regulator
VEETLPLTTLLSQALVAYTIEFDNEFERQSPHRTTLQGRAGGGGPWLVSMVMWFNCMRYVGEAAFPVAELERRARTPTNLGGMHRWRYVDVEASPDDKRAKPPDGDLLVRATRKGLLARQVWQPLARDIETRWEERFGIARIDALSVALRALVAQIDLDLPDCMPILHFGLASAGPPRPAFSPRSREADDADTLALPSLLSRALLMIAIDFESRSKVSLAMHADLLRVLRETSTPLREIPRLTGVSKEAISMGMGVIVKRGLAVLEPNPNGKAGKAVRLTGKGIASQDAHAHLLRTVEEQHVSRYGADVTSALRESLGILAGDSRGSRLLHGIPPFPDGWRASVPKAETLPHFPMVLHRGGYPDGS